MDTYNHTFIHTQLTKRRKNENKKIRLYGLKDSIKDRKILFNIPNTTNYTQYRVKTWIMNEVQVFIKMWFGAFPFSYIFLRYIHTNIPYVSCGGSNKNTHIVREKYFSFSFFVCLHEVWWVFFSRKKYFLILFVWRVLLFEFVLVKMLTKKERVKTFLRKTVCQFSYKGKNKEVPLYWV